MKLPKGRVPQPSNVDAFNAYVKKVAVLNGASQDAARKFIMARSSTAKAAVASGDAAVGILPPPVPVKKETMEERIARISNRFDHLLTIVRGCCLGKHRAAIVSGAGGVGKTHNIKRILEHFHENKGLKYTVKSGVVSPVHLYKLLYDYREEGNVIVLDDMDGIFFNEDGLSILKAALDSEKVREISWMTNSAMLKKEDVPDTFKYMGTMIFITNIDFQSYIDLGKSQKLAPHLQALMTRAHYLDLMLHEPADLFAWIRYVVTKHHVLVQDGLSQAQETAVLTFMEAHLPRLRNLSIRTAKKIGEHVLQNPHNWKPLAEATELKQEMIFA